MDKIEHLLRSDMLAVKLKHFPPEKDYVGYRRLSLMESPYALPESLQDKWIEELKKISLNRYPDDMAIELCETARKNLDVPANVDLMFANGSMEFIQLLISIFAATTQAAVLAPCPSFFMYQSLAKVAGVKFISIPLQPDFELDEEKMLAAILEYQPALIFLASPNNPTGNLFDEKNN